VYPDIPSSCTVLVVVEDESNILVENIQQCIQEAGITLVVMHLGDLKLEAVRHCNLVLAVMLDVDTACKINTMARESLAPFLYCNLVPGYTVLFYDHGDGSITDSYEAQLTGDILPVHVGDVIKGEDDSSIIIFNRHHCLLVGDSVKIGRMEMSVIEVITDKEVKVSHGDSGDIRQGDLLLRLSRTDLSSTHKSLSTFRDSVPAPDKSFHSIKHSPVLKYSAGLVVTSILDSVTKRFPLDNSLRLYSLPSVTTESILKMESESILVFGCNELATYLIKSLVELNVRLITVLCMSKHEETNIGNLATSFGDNSTKIEFFMFNPSNHDLQSLQALWRQASIVVCVGGTIEERMLVHSFGVQLSRPGVDMAVQGRMGHVEPIVPHLTTSYTCTSSPLDHQPPFCVLKSFPHLPEHAAAWAKGKLANLLHVKPNICHQFIADHIQSPDILSTCQGPPPPGSVVTFKLLSMFGPNPTWKKCVHIARLKFEKYFSYKALQLQSSFNADTTVSSGDLFWSWPKLYPRPISFDETNSDHLEFVALLAVGLARVVGIQEESLDRNAVIRLMEDVNVEPFVPANKEIVTDENVTISSVTASNVDVDLVKLSSMLGSSLSICVSDLPASLATRLSVVTCHLRCDMYNIPRATDQQVLAFMGYLEPCLPSTVQCVTGLGIAEIIKICASSGSCSHSNWWVGQGQVIYADTVKPASTKLSPHLSVTLWDKLEIQGSTDTTLHDFLEMMKIKYQLEVTMVVQDSRMVYVPIMPGHNKRLPKLMSSLVKNPDATGAVLLSVTAASEGDEEDLTVPPVRYVLD